MKIKTLILSMALASMSTYASNEDHHFAGIFVGATSIDSKTDFSYGVEYEYKFSKQWGAGIVFEKTEDAHHGDGVEVILASAYLHPWKNLRVGVGFGQEKVGGHHSHKDDLIRASISYDFHIAEIGIAPTIAVDFVDGEKAIVFGVAFIKSF